MDCSPGHGTFKKDSFIVSCKWSTSKVYLLLCVSFMHMCIIICPILVVLGSLLLLGSLSYV